jgi:Flp pilus assembly protein TadG
MVDIRKYRGLVWFAGGLKRAGRDEKGVAAVEFGLIAPVLLLMLVGTIEVSRAVSMDRRFGTVTSMVADLVAREKTITSGDVNSI